MSAVLGEAMLSRRMQSGSSWRVTQPAVGIVMSVVAVAAIIERWLVNQPMFAAAVATPASRYQALETTALASGLAIALFLSYRFPIHIRYTIKMQMGSVPLYLMAVLLPPSVAAIAAALGTLAGEILVRKTRGTYPSDIAAQTGRWSIIILMGSLLAHMAPATVPVHMLLYGAVALLLLAGDLLTGALSAAPITGEHLWVLLGIFARGVGMGEAGQYLMGLMGAIVAMQDIWGTLLLILPVALLYRTCKRAKEMNDTTYQLLIRMAKAVDLRDPYTGGHSDRVYKLTKKLLIQLHVTGPEAALITTAARVHDIGKIKTPDAILRNHGKLAPEEWTVMEQHPADGADILARYPDFVAGAAIVRSHHERWDGQGYPDKRAGPSIPFGARVLAVCDSFDAMTSDRPYRNGMSAARAAAILRSGSGTQWEPRIVDAFLKCMKDHIEDEVVSCQVSGVAPQFTDRRSATNN